MDNKQEERALRTYKIATEKLFKENFESSYLEFNRVVSLYPETHIAMKSRFMICMINKMELFVNCLLAESFSNGVRALKQNALLDLFNKNKYYFVNEYEKYAAIRLDCFNRFSISLKNLIEADNYSVIHSYINFSADVIKDCAALAQIDEIRDGHIYPPKELRRIINELSRYLSITIIADDFDIDFTDELSTIVKRKLNRVNFYHSCLAWLVKFYEVEQNYRTGELIRNTCRIILGLTNDSANPKRQLAFETLSKFSKNYYTMQSVQEKIEEIEVTDIEDVLFMPEIARKMASAGSLMELAVLDEALQACSEKTGLNLLRPSQIALEIDLTPTNELIEAKETIPEDLKASEIDKFDLKIEFD